MNGASGENQMAAHESNRPLTNAAGSQTNNEPPGPAFPVVCCRIEWHSGDNAMVTVKSIPEGVQAVFPMLVCQSPEAEMNFCAAAFGAVEQVRRPGPDGSPIHIAMRINEAFLVVQSEFPDVVASRAPSRRWELARRHLRVRGRRRSGRGACSRDGRKDPHACTESILG